MQKTSIDSSGSLKCAMRRLSFIISFCIFSIYSLQAQYFSNLYYDNRPAMLFGSIKPFGDNYYVTGVTTTKTNPYYEKALFGKINQDGGVDSIYAIIDNNQYSYALFMNALKKTADGNFITTGYMNDSVERAFIMKIDTLGNILLWHEYADTTTLLYEGDDVIEIPGQGYLIIINANYNHKGDVLILRTDTLGDTINQHLYGLAGDDIPLVIRPMFNGHYMVGAGNGKLNGNTPYWTQTWLLEIDSLGNMVSNWLDSDTKTGWPYGMLETPDSGWIITRQHLAYDVSNFQQFTASVLKLDKNFNKKWELILGDSSPITGFNDIEQLADGNFIACGTTPTWGYDSAYIWGWLVKIDTAGNVLWDRKFPAVARYGVQSILYDLQIMPNGDFVACGEMDYTVDLGITPIQQGWIIRTDSNGCLIDSCWLTGIEEINQPEVGLKVFPNPANSECTLKIDEPNQMSNGVVFDAIGRQVMLLFNNQQISSFNFNCSPLSSGLYFVRVIDNMGKVGVVKMVKE